MFGDGSINSTCITKKSKVQEEIKLLYNICSNKKKTKL